MNPAPIAFFAFNRPVHTKRTIEALLRNEQAAETDFYAFCDGPRHAADAPGVEVVRNYVTRLTGFRSVQVLNQARNFGLAQSIINGVTKVCREHGRVIVVEDDLVTSPFFLRYLNDSLTLYEADPEVISIHGYVYPVKKVLPETFFLKGADCWGWATWQRGWALFNPDGQALLAELERRKLTRAFDFDSTYPYTAMLRQQIAGTVNSWAIRWYASAFLLDKLTLYPGRSLVQNIGHDNSGEHCGKTTAFNTGLASQPVIVNRLPLAENQSAQEAFKDYFCQLQRPSLKQKLARLLRTRSMA